MRHRWMNLTAALSIATAALCAGVGPAAAHGTATARHGGVAAFVQDLNFELVTLPTGAALYIDDHGKPMPLAGITGRLTVLQGGQKSEADFTIRGERLEASGFRLAPGAKAVAVLTLPTKKTVTVRFALR